MIRTLIQALAVGVCTAALPAQADVTGVIRDQATANPIAGALVTLQATSIRTTSQADGSYVLAAPTGADRVIVAAKKGYYN